MLPVRCMPRVIADVLKEHRDLSGRRLAVNSFACGNLLCVRAWLEEAIDLESSQRCGDYVVLMAPLVLKSQVCMVSGSVEAECFRVHRF